MKFARILNDVVDTISLEPQEGQDWEVVPDDVFAGFVRAEDGWAAPAKPEAEAAPISLSPAQWHFFLDLTGFREALDAALAAMPKASLLDRQSWAALRAIAFGSSEYRLDVTLQLVAQVRLMGLPIGIPTDADIETAFGMAAQFHGASSLLGEGA